MSFKQFSSTHTTPPKPGDKPAAAPAAGLPHAEPAPAKAAPAVAPKA